MLEILLTFALAFTVLCIFALGHAIGRIQGERDGDWHAFVKSIHDDAEDIED